MLLRFIWRPAIRGTHHTSHITHHPLLLARRSLTLTHSLTHSLTSAFCLLPAVTSVGCRALTLYLVILLLLTHRSLTRSLTHSFACHLLHSHTHSLTHHFTLPPLITQFQPYRRPVFGTKMCTRSVTDRQREKNTWVL
jgi:hypothetical protein